MTIDEANREITRRVEQLTNIAEVNPDEACQQTLIHLYVGMNGYFRMCDNEQEFRLRMSELVVDYSLKAAAQ